MNELLQKIEAAITEIEEFAVDAAQQVGDGNWQQRGARIVTVADRDREVADYAIVECIDHIVRNDPARVLRRVARDRKVLARHEPLGEPPYADCRTCHGSYLGWPCPDVRDLAEDYDIQVERP